MKCHLLWLLGGRRRDDSSLSYIVTFHALILNFFFFAVCNKSGDRKCTFKYTGFSSLCTMTEKKENYDTITLTRGPSTGGNTHVIKTNVEHLATRGRYMLMI